jgi:hypothetical protein
VKRTRLTGTFPVQHSQRNDLVPIFQQVLHQPIERFRPALIRRDGYEEDASIASANIAGRGS